MPVVPPPPRQSAEFVHTLPCGHVTHCPPDDTRQDAWHLDVAGARLVSPVCAEKHWNTVVVPLGIWHCTAPNTGLVQMVPAREHVQEAEHTHPCVLGHAVPGVQAPGWPQLPPIPPQLVHWASVHPTHVPAGLVPTHALTHTEGSGPAKHPESVEHLYPALPAGGGGPPAGEEHAVPLQEHPCAWHDT